LVTLWRVCDCFLLQYVQSNRRCYRKVFMVYQAEEDFQSIYSFGHRSQSWNLLNEECPIELQFWHTIWRISALELHPFQHPLTHFLLSWMRGYWFVYFHEVDFHPNTYVSYLYYWTWLIIRIILHKTNVNSLTIYTL